MPDFDQISDRAKSATAEITDLLRRLRAAGKPIKLSINGRGNLPVKDDGAYQLLLALVDRLEVTEVLRERLADLDAGRPTLSMEEAKEHVRAKDGISL